MTHNTPPYSGELPAELADFKNPFFYSSFHNVEGYFLVNYTPDVAVLIAPLLLEGLNPYLDANGKILISHNYQNYTGQTPDNTNVTNEIEFNLLCYPIQHFARIPNLSFTEILKGKDTTKLIGNQRLLVTCDNRFAVKAGIDLYGEPKTVASFNNDMPSPNNFNAVAEKWTILCSDLKAFHDLNVDDTAILNGIFSTFVANVTGLQGQLSHISPVTQFGQRDGKLIGCNLNIFPISQLYLAMTSDQLSINFVDYSSDQLLNKHVKNVITLFHHSSLTPFAIRTVQSQPVAIQNGPYYL